MQYTNLFSTKENVSLDFRLKNIDDARNYLLEEKKTWWFNKWKTVYRALNHFEHFVVFVSAVSGCVLISASSSLVGVYVSIANTVVQAEIFAVTAGIKKYKPIYQEKEEKS